jgi:hypothetical protein
MDYAQDALDLYTKILNKNIQPNDIVFQYSLYACAKLGNVKFAYDILSQMKAVGFPMKSVHIHAILSTYSTAVSAHFVPESLVKLYVQDGWDLFNKSLSLDAQNNSNGDLVSQKLVTTQVLNSLLELNVKALKLKDAEELVLPMYSQLGFEFTDKTYEVSQLLI